MEAFSEVRHLLAKLKRRQRYATWHTPPGIRGVPCIALYLNALADPDRVSEKHSPPARTEEGRLPRRRGERRHCRYELSGTYLTHPPLCQRSNARRRKCR